MSEEINQELLAIIKAWYAKVESLAQTVYHKDNLLMKSGFVVSNTPTPAMEGVIGGSSVIGKNVADMEWSEIHKMVENME